MSKYVIGADEVGYGALCGPVVVGAVIAPHDWSIPGLNDSKKLTDKQRRVMDEKLRTLAKYKIIQFSIALEDNKNIDTYGVSKCLKKCYGNSIGEVFKTSNLTIEDVDVIVDGNLKLSDVLGDLNYTSVVKADTTVPSVMAASILAKVFRDDIMVALAPDFPEYEWESNKGYGSQVHIDAIKKIGYSEYHRKSYKLK